MLLITNKLKTGNIGGREQLCRLNYNILQSIYKDKLYTLEIKKHTLNSFFNKISAFRGYIDGIDENILTSISNIIVKNNIHEVFIDGSNFGELSRVVKVRFPQIEVYTFFHNVEAIFFLSSFKHTLSVHALLVFVANYIAERKSIKYSDKLICLSSRDSKLLNKWYGRYADYISPMSIQDKYTGKQITYCEQQKYSLFVGGDFYANFIGIKWFVDNVSPFINVPTYIVGRGMQKYKDRLEINDNVKVIGEVNDLESWYLNAYFIIAPIFDGSGMKTKTAEALMFGKKVIGTPESFSGYEKVSDRIGCMCETAEEFIVAINNVNEIISERFDKKLRAMYIQNYSFVAAKNRFKKMLSI